ncbi:MAG: histidine triad nucleotide-binding protein [Actinomycetota bacterium]|nr:histidine triad nucleotide-binding protein [Actinomycetota bacterium]
MDDCIFCRIATGKLASDIVYEDNDVIAFTDINPEAPTHLLVVPRRHIASLNTAEPADAELLGKAMLTAASLAKQRGLDGPGYRIVANTGKEAGQTVDHIHFHLLGGRFMSWPPG